jgi:hypothetical protein
MIRHMSIRLRLTLWYGVVLSVILVGFSASVYVLMRHHLLARGRADGARRRR